MDERNVNLTYFGLGLLDETVTEAIFLKGRSSVMMMELVEFSRFSFSSAAASRRVVPVVLVALRTDDEANEAATVDLFVCLSADIVIIARAGLRPSGPLDWATRPMKKSQITLLPHGLAALLGAAPTCLLCSPGNTRWPIKTHLSN